MLPALALVLLAPALQDSPALTAQEVAQLAGLGRLWGEVELLHPWLYSGRGLDWDRALLDAIPRVAAATNGSQYREALGDMLAALGDPATRLEEPESDAAPFERAGVEVAPNDVRVVTAPCTRKGATALDAFARGEEPLSGVVFDLRTGSPSADRGELAVAFERALARLLRRRLRLGGERHVIHSGWAPDRGQTSGGYVTGFSDPRGTVVDGAADEDVPIVCLIDDHTAGVLAHLVALQEDERGRIVLESARADLDHATASVRVQRVRLPHGVEALVRTTELVGRDGRLGLRPDVRVELAEDRSVALGVALEVLAGVRAAKTPEYDHAPEAAVRRARYWPWGPYPPREARLLGLFRAWTVLASFFPYHHLTDAPFDQALEELLPAFWEADSALGYHRGAAALAVRLQDTHARAVSDVLAVHVGGFEPPLEVRFVEGRATVVALLDEDLLGVAPGDVLVGIDGRTVEERCAELLPLLSCSTPQARDLNLGWMLLLGAQGSAVDLCIRGGSGIERHVRLERTMRGAREVRSTPVYGVLASGHGYMDLARLERDQVDAAFDALAGTAAMIFDVRGRTRDTLGSIAMHLSVEAIGTAYVERLQRGVPGPGDASRLEYVSMSRLADGPRYAGPVVALIDARALSQAESTCLVLESATAGAALFVGTPTSGANGDLTIVELPGEVALYFSGQSVSHRDGRELQRAGIQPDIHAAPTLAGVRAGRDEVLERALRFLETGE